MPGAKVQPPERPPHPRIRSALGALAAVAGALVVGLSPAAPLEARWPLVVCCALLALAGGLSAAGGARAARVVDPAAATLRLCTAMLALALWRGEARDLWGALAVWVAWRDADEGLWAKHPLAPLAIALGAVMAWAGYRGSAAGPRAVLVAAVAALAVARASERRG